MFCAILSSKTLNDSVWVQGLALDTYSSFVTSSRVRFAKIPHPEVRSFTPGKNRRKLPARFLANPLDRKERIDTMSPAASSKPGKGKADPQETAGGSYSTRNSLRVKLKEAAAAAPSSSKKKPQPAILKTLKKEAPVKKTKTSAGIIP
jgi:hypothetical protein